MNGAEAVLRTLADLGLEAFFTNPGMSEMQMVAAFDRERRVRPVLCLFEGVATAAADGYARMAGKPASNSAAPTRPTINSEPSIKVLLLKASG